MDVYGLFIAAWIPVLKMLLVTGVGSFLATDFIALFTKEAGQHLNNVVYYVLNPSLVANNLSQTFTMERVTSTWFMPVNIILTFVVGSAFGWILNKITKAPPQLKPILLGCCASGNLGVMLLIVIPGTCHERGSPFGETAICHAHAMAYASLSMGINDLVFWSYVYNIVRISLGVRDPKMGDGIDSNTTSAPEEPMVEEGTKSIQGAKLDDSSLCIYLLQLRTAVIAVNGLLTPSTYGVIVGIAIGVISPFRKALIGESAPLRAVQGAVMLLGEGAVPLTTLIMGGNLLKGFRKAGMKVIYIVGVTAVRYVFLPLAGVAIVKGAIHFHILRKPDPLFQFVLLVQYALPPAMNMGVISQLLGIGESHCSIIFFWTYALTLVLFPLWSAIFMWLVS
ncbi:hypothetical protein KSP39_PZI006599 [Platanthera zijinensis]|uniref:Auxin efflux carrier n=1 Tax=Platanthera zijinensis TaxID=2320716 RepID=A0AAP0BR19_9ASPA